MTKFWGEQGTKTIFENREHKKTFYYFWGEQVNLFEGNKGTGNRWLCFKTEPSEQDWLQVYDITQWWKIVLRTGASLFICNIVNFMPSFPDSDCKHNGAVWKIIKIGFPNKKKIQNGAKCTLQLIFWHFAYNIYKPVCSENIIYFCILMHASSTWLLGLVITGVILIGWFSHVIQVNVTWVPKEFWKNTETCEISYTQ